MGFGGWAGTSYTYIYIYTSSAVICTYIIYTADKLEITLYKLSIHRYMVIYIYTVIYIYIYRMRVCVCVRVAVAVLGCLVQFI